MISSPRKPLKFRALVVGTGVLLYGACSTSTTKEVGSGGTPGSAGSGSGGSGGSGGAASGGATGSGGDASTGGSVGSGGVAGGGATASGGATPTGGRSATGTGGRGGSTGGGGRSSGGAGTSGSGGAAGAPGTDGGVTDAAVPTTKFSFFVTSLKVLQDLSKNSQGFGGDLRFGETGAGSGLRGADKICATIAERSMPGAGAKPWRAFLSAVTGEDGKQVDAIDRIGNGPWYDRLGRTFALTKDDLLFDRPRNADPAIANDFPNEDGVPNHAPDPTAGAVDNHDTLTGSGTNGKLYSATATCADWTGKTGTEGKPRVGHTWPRGGGGGGMMMPGGGDGGGMFPGGGSGANWISALDESGCAPGVSLVEMGGPLPTSNTVGSGGGYGAFYCFSLTP